MPQSRQFGLDEVLECFRECSAQHRSKLRYARAGWNGKGMYIFLVPGSTFTVNRPPLSEIHPEGTEIRYQPHIDMFTADGTVVPWVVSQSDLLATDWIRVEQL